MRGNARNHGRTTCLGAGCAPRIGNEPVTPGRTRKPRPLTRTSVYASQEDSKEEIRTDCRRCPRRRGRCRGRAHARDPDGGNGPGRRVGRDPRADAGNGHPLRRGTGEAGQDTPRDTVAGSCRAAPPGDRENALTGKRPASAGRLPEMPIPDLRTTFLTED